MPVRTYDTQRWRDLRKAFLQRNPLCVDCQKIGRVKAATHVDHVKSAAEHPELAWTWSNLQGLCHSHHSAKTAQVDRAFGRQKGARYVKGCDLSGWPVDPGHLWNRDE